MNKNVIRCIVAEGVKEGVGYETPFACGDDITAFYGCSVAIILHEIRLV